MAVYYVSPFTTTNGSGTWASPYSANVATRTALVAGDEVRIVAKPLSTLLTATVYTATNTNNYQITITAGGALGTDFPVGTFVYFQDNDAFGYVTAVSGNLVSFGSTTNLLPLKSSAAGQALTIRKVDAAQAPVSSNGTTAYVYPDANWVGGITMTDGWVAAGVRVTDGTAKSIFTTSTTGTAMTWNIDNAPNAYYLAPKSTYDLRHTHFMGSKNAAGTTSFIAGMAADITVNQLHGTSVAVPYIGGRNTFAVGVTINIKHLYGNFANLFLRNSVVNIENLYRGGVGHSNYCIDVTFNIDTTVLYTASYLITASITVPGAKSVLNFNTAIDFYAGITLSGVAYQPGAYTVNINCPIYQNRRASNVNFCTRKFLMAADMNSTSPVVATPVINCPLLIVSSEDSLAGYRWWPVTLDPTAGLTNYNVPKILELRAGQTTTSLPIMFIQPSNVLITFQDGGSPLEVLGIGLGSASPTSPTGAGDRCPVVSLDATQYVTTGPSLKAYLGAFVDQHWSGRAQSSKTVKIPVVAGTSYTVTGYIKTDHTTYLTGDCRATIQGSSSEIVGQNMTTACVGAWEQFTLTFTAATTGEVHFAWIMRFSQGAVSYWLDDLTIS